MGDYGQPYLPMDWNTQQFPAYQSLTLANNTPSRNYRNALSKVSKPSSAGNSPHSHPRRRTMASHNGLRTQPINAGLFSLQSSLVHLNTQTSKSNTSLQQRQSRPTSWHPSLRQSSSQPSYYVPNCHPSWLRDVSVPDLEQQPSTMTSMYGLSTPITCPISGDLLSTNDYFESYNYLPPGSQTYTPVESSEWSTYSIEGTPLSAYPWMQHYSSGLVSSDPAVDFGHESVASADDLTAPPTPDLNPQDYMTYNRHSGEQQPIISHDNTEGDDLVAVGLYDEPEPLSFGGSTSLFGGDFTYQPSGKGLKLEETFTPTPEADEDEDADAENDDEED